MEEKSGVLYLSWPGDKESRRCLAMEEMNTNEISLLLYEKLAVEAWL
jgi:hypothetical protein